MLKPSEARDRLTAGCYINEDPNDVTGKIEYALMCVMDAKEAEKKIKDSRLKKPYNIEYEPWLEQLAGDGVIEKSEIAKLVKLADATREVVAVDDFPNDFAQGGVVVDTGEAAIQKSA